LAIVKNNRQRSCAVRADNLAETFGKDAAWRGDAEHHRVGAIHPARTGLIYFRKTLAQFGERVCETPEAFKAWSQNLGHENVLTTFASYGQVATPRQAELIRELGKPKSEVVDLHALVRDVARIKESLPY
jgi:hypothetical protein